MSTIGTVTCEAGCAAQKEYDPSQVVEQPGAQVGDLTRCPVSGAVFEVMPDQPSVEVEGNCWHIFCGSCAAKLNETSSTFMQRI